MAEDNAGCFSSIIGLVLGLVVFALCYVLSYVMLAIIPFILIGFFALIIILFLVEVFNGKK